MCCRTFFDKTEELEYIFGLFSELHLSYLNTTLQILRYTGFIMDTYNHLYNVLGEAGVNLVRDESSYVLAESSEIKEARGSCIYFLIGWVAIGLTPDSQTAQFCCRFGCISAVRCTKCSAAVGKYNS